MTDKPPQRVAMISLGCPKNQVDSELMLGRLAADGFTVVDDPDDADLLVINTCSFIDRARTESVETLVSGVEWKQKFAGRRLIAAGCLVQRSGNELRGALPEIDALIGLDELHEISKAAMTRRRGVLPAYEGLPSTRRYDGSEPRRLLSPGYSAYLKIAEGCNQNCAFCAIPTFRGRMRSRTIEDLCDEASRLAAQGVVEVNLVAQDSTGYGRDLELRNGLADLIDALDALEDGPRWVRLHYLYPGRISARLLEAMARAEKLVEYVDLPLQHADRGMLQRMNRPGSAEKHLEQLAALRLAMPGAGVRSSFIVGFPGETDAEFQTLADFVASAGFDAVGVFSYSHEEQTSARLLPDDVPAELKEERRQALEEIAADAAHERNLTRVGTRLELLIEGPAEDAAGFAQARWRGQAPEVDGRVLIQRGFALAPGTFVEGEIIDAGPHELTARLTGMR